MKTNEELKQTNFLKFESLMEDGGKCVLFMDNSGSHQIPYFIWCSKDGWDHVIGSYSDRFFTPMEIELIKRFFFHDDERDAIEVVPAAPDEARPYGAHFWLKKGGEAKRPKPYDHLPQEIAENKWMCRISTMYTPAIMLQVFANGTTPEEYLDNMGTIIERLFADNSVLTIDDCRAKFSFYKKPSVEAYFLWCIAMAEKRKEANPCDVRSSVVRYKGKPRDPWKKLVHPLLYNAVIQQANHNRMSPDRYLNGIKRQIDEAYAGEYDLNTDTVAAILHTIFVEKPTVEEVFLYFVMSETVNDRAFSKG